MNAQGTAKRGSIEAEKEASISRKGTLYQCRQGTKLATGTGLRRRETPVTQDNPRTQMDRDGPEVPDGQEVPGGREDGQGTHGDPADPADPAGLEAQEDSEADLTNQTLMPMNGIET